MRFIILAALALIACAGLFFFALHHRRNPDTFKACTLSEIYQQFFDDRPKTSSPRFTLFWALGATGLFASFYPFLLILLLGERSRGFANYAPAAVLILCGMVALAGAVANFLGIIISHMNFAWGGSADRNQTFFYWLIPLFQLSFSLLSIVAGCSTTICNWLIRLIG